MIDNKNKCTSFDVLLTVHLSIMLVINQLNAQILVYNKFIICSTCFEHYVLIIRRLKIVLTSGIITPVGGRPVHGTVTYRCDDTRCCITQFLNS